MAFLLPLVAALVSLLILPVWSFYFDVVPKIVVVLSGAAVALAFARQVRLNWLGILLALQAVTIILATLFSTHPPLSVLGSTWRRDGLLAELAVLVLVIAAPIERTVLLRITVLSAIPVAAYGIAQYFGIDPWIPPSGYHFGEGQFTIVRPPSTLGHAAYFATYLLYVVFAGAALSLLETKRAWKSAALITAGLACFALVLSGTRAALVGLVMGALFVAVRERLNWKCLAGAAASLTLVAGFYIAPAGERLRARVHWSSEDPLGGSRLLLWRDTLRMSGARWLTGYGPETFAVEFPQHQSIELARAYPDFYHESPHNIFLDALVSKGILGLLALVAVVGFGLSIARGPIGGAFVAMLVAQQFTAFTVPTELYFYLPLAILVTAPSGRGSVSKLVNLPIAALFAGFALYVATGDVLLGLARRALDRRDAGSAAQYVEQARKWHATADIYFSRRFPSPYAMDAARHAPQSAEDRQNAWLNLAVFQAAQDDAASVEHSLRESIAAAPNWFKPHGLLAQVLLREGRLSEAQTETRAATARGMLTPR